MTPAETITRNAPAADLSQLTGTTLTTSPPTLIQQINSIDPSIQFFVLMIVLIFFIAFTKQKDVTDLALLLGTSYGSFIVGKAQQIINTQR